MSDYKFWKDAKPVKGTVFDKGFIMSIMNRERARLARRIRFLEARLGRPHRYLPQCGCVQFIPKSVECHVLGPV